MKPLFAIALAALLLGPLGYVRADDKKDDNATKIVGTWVLEKSDDAGAPAGATVTFTKDGKLTIQATVNGMELKFEGTYKVEKDMLVSEMKIGEETKKDTDTIKKLTDKELELQDKDKKVTTFKKK
jgi:uncharacterized protein (TIGR03066 family)